MYKKLIENYKEPLLKTLKEFVSINSVLDPKTIDEENPFGKGVANALKYIETVAKEDGFEVNNYDNMVVEILCGKGDKNITILAHADVVPEGRGWSHDPFDMQDDGEVLYGRGVADDKGPLLAAYFALKALKDNNLLGNYQVRFIVGGNEESGSLGVDYYFNTLKKKQPTYGFSPDAEFPLIYAEKGIYTFKAKGEVLIRDVISIKVVLHPILLLKNVKLD
jgi:succinyl-diaminopimelate desuccinylase